MRRREFITLLGGAAAAWPLSTRAQQAERIRRIGVLMSVAANDPEGQARIVVFLQGLEQLGLTDGRNVRIETRWTSGTAEDARKYAAELVALAPDVILSAGSFTVGPLLQATHSIPIVFVHVPDPVAAGCRRQPGAPWRQRHRFHPVRIQHERKMAGTAQRDHAQRDASGGRSGSRHYRRDRAVQCHPGRG